MATSIADESGHAAGQSMQAFADEYVEGYELRDAEDANGNTGDYTPSERMAEKAAAARAAGAALVREQDLPDAPSPPSDVERWYLVPQASAPDALAPPQPARSNTGNR